LSSSEITTSFLEHSDDDEGIHGSEEITKTGDETTRSPLEDIGDKEDADFSQATSSVGRKMKINRLITEDESLEWLKNDVDDFG
jgi:hypothetical protein